MDALSLEEVHGKIAEIVQQPDTFLRYLMTSSVIVLHH